MEQRDMKAQAIKRVGLILAAGGFASVGVAGGVATAAAGDPAAGASANARVHMFQQGKNLGFKGATKVSSGSTLTIVNKTDPQKIGPHTFTLIRKQKLPSTKRQMKRCEQTRGVCGDVAKAHEFVPPATINEPDVDVGKPGWDRSFGKRGDSWYTEQQGERTSRVISARPGTTLYYFCAVHPFMTGKIKVVG
jgi:plastocyanin